MPDDPPRAPVGAATVGAATVDAAPVEAALAGRRGLGPPRRRAPRPPPLPATAVLDLRDEVPSRHRPTRACQSRPPSRRVPEPGEAWPSTTTSGAPALIGWGGWPSGPTPRRRPSRSSATDHRAARHPRRRRRSGRPHDLRRGEVGGAADAPALGPQVSPVLPPRCLLAVAMLAGAILWRLANEQGVGHGLDGLPGPSGSNAHRRGRRHLARASA